MNDIVEVVVRSHDGGTVSILSTRKECSLKLPDLVIKGYASFHSFDRTSSLFILKTQIVWIQLFYKTQKGVSPQS